MPPRILILDDDRTTTKVVSVVLAALGYEPVESHCPLTAIAKVKAETFQLLIADYHMPGMTGLEVVQALRKDSCGIKVVLMSGDCAAIDFRLAERMGVFAILPKPFGVADLKDVLSLVLLSAQTPRKKKNTGIKARSTRKAVQVNESAVRLRGALDNVLANA